MVEDGEASVPSKNLFSLSAVCGMSFCKGEVAKRQPRLCVFPLAEESRLSVKHVP